MTCDRFVEAFEHQYPHLKWDEIQASIFSMFRETFEAAVSKDPPAGIGHSPQSRAMYAADLMLSWDGGDASCKRPQPKLLEINWGPDCKRAADYYPDFFDRVFEALFLDQGGKAGNCFTKL